MTDTTVPTGWIPDVSPKPASKPQIDALIARLNSSRHKDKRSVALRKNAVAALDNASECVSIYFNWIEQVEDAEDNGMTAEELCDALSADLRKAEADAKQKRLVEYEIGALEKMRADFLATSDPYLHQRAENIAKQIAFLRGEVTG